MNTSLFTIVIIHHLLREHNVAHFFFLLRGFLRHHLHLLTALGGRIPRVIRFLTKLFLAVGVLARVPVAARALASEVGAEARLEPRRRSGGFEIGGLLVVVVVALTFLPYGFDVIGRWDWVDGSGVGWNLVC